MPATYETYTATRLNVEVPGVHEFQRVYERAVPANDLEEISALVRRGASWADVIDAHADSAPHGFLIHWREDVHGVMRLANDANDCIAYLMGNVTIAEQIFRHEPGAMLYTPLRAVIWKDADARAWFTVDQPSTQLAGFGNPAVSAVGVELDRKLAALLELLRVEVPLALLSSRATT